MGAATLPIERFLNGAAAAPMETSRSAS
jgi:hypothetical protein